jgi:hypothetical protein
MIIFINNVNNKILINIVINILMNIFTHILMMKKIYQIIIL